MRPPAQVQNVFAGLFEQCKHRRTEISDEA
jgi:hypothetical protein